MTNIFGAVWVYLGHESQIPRNDDYITLRLGLRPIILLRDSAGKIRALFNRCTHRGTTLCRKDKGSARIFTCPYHGWSFLNTGKLRAVPWPDGYACDFKDAKFNVAQVPRVDSYRGFIFGTLNPDAPPLIDYLGAITKPIDEWLDRQPKARSRCAKRTGSNTRATGNLPTTIPATAITSCSRTAHCWKWRTAKPTSPTRACPTTRARPTPRRCTWPIWVTATISRTSGRTSRSARADCGRWKGRRRAPSIIRRSCGGASAPGPRTFSTSLPPSRSTSTCFPIAAGKPHPGVRAGLGR